MIMPQDSHTQSPISQIGGAVLGLVIVKHIVNRHCGGLLINSTLGGAAKFLVNRPLAPSSDVAI